MIDQATYARALLLGDLAVTEGPLAAFRVSGTQWSIHLSRRAGLLRRRACIASSPSCRPGMLLSQPTCCAATRWRACEPLQRRFVYLYLGRRLRPDAKLYSAQSLPAPDPRVARRLSGMTQTRPCPTCHNSAVTRTLEIPEQMFGLPESFPYSECSECSSLYITELPTDLTKYYDTVQLLLVRPGPRVLHGSPRRAPSRRCWSDSPCSSGPHRAIERSLRTLLTRAAHADLDLRLRSTRRLATRSAHSVLDVGADGDPGLRARPRRPLALGSNRSSRAEEQRVKRTVAA